MERFVIFLMLALAAAAGGSSVVLYENTDVIHWGFSTLYQDQEFLAAWTAEQWQEQIKVLPQQARVGLPEIDFETQLVVGVYMGEKNTGGYQTALGKVELQGDWLVAVVFQREPQPGQMVTQAFSYPIDVVLLDKEFLQHEEIQPVGVRFIDPDAFRLREIRF